MLNLQELNFVVNTNQLDAAIKKVEALGTAAEKLAKPMQTVAKASKAANTEITASAEAATKATDRKAKADKEAGTEASKLDKLLDKLNMRYTDMASGSTSAEASILHLARSLGATTADALKPYMAALENIRGLSKSPFDTAIGSVRSITQEYDAMNKRAELAAKGIYLTTTQLKEYSKIANEIRGQVTAAGLNPSKGAGLEKYNTELKKQQDIYLGIATDLNKAVTAEKERNAAMKQQLDLSVKMQEASDNLFKFNQLRHKQDQQGYASDMKAMRDYYSAIETAEMKAAKSGKVSSAKSEGAMDSASATYYKQKAEAARQLEAVEASLEAREKKLIFTNAELANGLSISSANALYKFKTDLELTGKSVTEVDAKLNTLRTHLAQRQGKSIISQIGEDVQKSSKQVDYLTRALGPQITDVFVGLATGQSPLTVMLQQGGQLRDQIALAGVASKDMGKALVDAAKGMVTSVKDVGLAIAGLVATAAASPFVAMANAIKAPFKALSELTAITAQLEAGQISATRAARLQALAYAHLGESALAMSRVLMGTALVAVAALGVAMYQTYKQEAELSKAMATQGGTLGLTSNKAQELANSYGSVNGKIGSYMEAIVEASKAGNITSDNMKKVADSAMLLEKTAGVAVSETVKQFSKIAEKPTESIIELAKQMGTIDVATVKYIRSLELQGKYADAARVATDAYAASVKTAADEIKNDYGYMEKFFFGIGSAAKGMWDAILNVGRKGTLQEQLAKELKVLRSVQSTDVNYNYSLEEQGILNDQLEVIRNIEKQIEAEKKLGETKAKNSEDARKYEKTIKTQTAIDYNIPEDTALKKLQNDYKNSVKTIDSESNKLLAHNKANYALGLTELGAYTTEEIRLITEQNSAKIKLNDEYIANLKKLEEAQIKAINAEFSAKAGKSPATDAAKISKERDNAIKSVVANYDNLRESAKATNETLADNSIQQYERAMERLGANTKDAYNSIANLSSLGNIFGGATVGASNFIQALEKVGKTQEWLTAETKANAKVNAADMERQAELQKRLNATAESNTLSSYGNMVGALKSYSKEGSNTYAALANAEKVYHAFSLALSIKTMLEKIGVISTVTTAQVAGNQVAAASAEKSSLAEIAWTWVVGQAKAALAIVNQAASGDGITAWPRMAAMAGIMAALGFATGAFGGKGSSAAPTNKGTGTVFGDTNAKSESLTKSLALLNDTETSSLHYSKMMQKSLANIENNIGGFVNLLVRSTGISDLMGSVATGGFSTTASKIASSALNLATAGLGSLFKPLGSILGGLSNKLFGGSTSITGSGIASDNQTLGSIASGGFQGYNYADVTTTKKFLFFTTSTKTSQITSGLSQELENQISLMLTGMADAVSAGAVALGSDIADVNKRISNYVVSLGRIDLQGLTGTQITEKLTNVFGAEADKIAASIVPGLERLQKVGEGYFETLTRAVTQLEVVNLWTNRLGKTLGLTGTAGAIASDSLVKLFGSLSEFDSAVSDYYQNFYSEEERNANTLKELTKSFAGMNLVLPKSNDEYKKLVNSQDLTTEAGRNTYAALIKLSGAFYETSSAVETLSNDVGKSISEWLKSILGIVTNETVALNAVKSDYLTTLALARGGNSTALGDITGKAQSYLDLAKEQALTSSDFKLITAQVFQQVSSIPAVKSWNDSVLAALLDIAANTSVAPMAATGSPIIPLATMPDGSVGLAPAQPLGASQDALWVAIEKLNTNLDGLRDETRANVVNTSRTAKVLERVLEADTLKVQTVVVS